MKSSSNTAGSEPFIARIPGSKSCTSRALLIAALRPGVTEVVGASTCDDVLHLAQALGSFGGLAVERTPTGFRVTRAGDAITAPAAALDVAGSGTGARFLLAFAASAGGTTVVTGNARLRERPMDDLVATLRSIGIHVECLDVPGRLPIRVTGGAPATRKWTVRGDVSSQFTSALLLLASRSKSGSVRLSVEGELVSRPYVAMTVAMMRGAGMRVSATKDGGFIVHPGPPAAASIQVEVDASGMSYFIAAGALTGARVRVEGIGHGSMQGDVDFVHVLVAMGGWAAISDRFIEFTGRSLRGIDVDMRAMPDAALTLAAVAARAQGSTRIRGIRHLRDKESDRVHVAATELARLGVGVEEREDALVIHAPAELRPARIRTYDDHRVAMAFGTLGLVVDGIEIEDPGCVAKSFPGFWDELDRFRRHLRGE